MTNTDAARLIVNLYGIAKQYGYGNTDYATAVAMACGALTLVKFHPESLDIPTVEVQLD